MKTPRTITRILAGVVCVLSVAPSHAGLIFHASYDSNPHDSVGSRIGSL